MSDAGDINCPAKIKKRRFVSLMLVKQIIRSLATLAIVLAIAGTVGMVWAAEVDNTAVILPRSVEPLTPFSASWAVADFDGDHRPDVAKSRIEGYGAGGYSFRIELQLSSGPQSAFTISTLDGFALNVTPKDVDGDNDLDLIITSGVLRRPVGVWINDGRGGFSQGTPSQNPAAAWMEGPQVASAGRLVLDGSVNFRDTRPVGELANDLDTQPLPPQLGTVALRQHRNALDIRSGADSSRAPPSLFTNL